MQACPLLGTRQVPMSMGFSLQRTQNCCRCVHAQIPSKTTGHMYFLCICADMVINVVISVIQTVFQQQPVHAWCIPFWRYRS